MDVNLGFLEVKDIPYRRGWPEGSCLSAYMFVIMMDTVVKYVLSKLPDAKLVLYSDDIACLAKDTEELTQIHR